MRFSALFDKHEAVRPVAPEGEVLALEFIEIVGRQLELRRGAVDKKRRQERIELGECHILLFQDTGELCRGEQCVARPELTRRETACNVVRPVRRGGEIAISRPAVAAREVIEKCGRIIRDGDIAPALELVHSAEGNQLDKRHNPGLFSICAKARSPAVYSEGQRALVRGGAHTVVYERGYHWIRAENRAV